MHPSTSCLLRHSAAANAARALRRVCPWLLSASALLLADTSQANEALARRYACTACHQAERPLVGPAWKAISAKYAAGSITAAQLAASMKAGSTGKWGATPMPPQTQVPDADLQALATWILSVGRP